MRQVLGEVTIQLGGGAVGYSSDAAFTLVQEINASFFDGPSQFAQDHLRIPGDVNGDRKVDAADYVVWRDSNGPAAEYTEWRCHFGLPAASGSGGAAGAAVPETAALLPLVVAASLIIVCRRRELWGN